MNIKYYFLFCIIPLLAACNDWLDVKPSTQIEKSEAESSLQGYRSMLIGAYIKMQSPDLYGKNMTYGEIEYLAQHWSSATKASAELELSNHNYDSEEAEKVLSVIFNSYYKVIFDLNSVLSNIDANKKLLVNHEYELIKGEALGMRAFCHLELLRLWGGIPSEVPVDSLLPYVTKRGKDINPPLPYHSYIDMIHKDLDEAEILLADIDPIRSVNVSQNKEYKLVGTEKIPTDFFIERRKRFNYFAVLATKARFFLWIGDKENALKYAQQVIEAKDGEGKRIFEMGTKADMDMGDYTLSSEHIFAIDNHRLEEMKQLDVFASRSYTLKKIFEKTDIRLNKLFYDRTENSSINTYTFKYSYTTELKSSRPRALNVMPLIRLSEMKLIEAETLPKQQGIQVLSELRAHRDLSPVPNISDRNFLRLLTLEYHREFYAEGQGFFASKRIAPRLDIKFPMYNTRINEAIYRIPIPKAEKLID